MDTIENSIYTAVLISCIVLAIVFGYFGFTIVRRLKKYYETQKGHFLAEIDLLNKERTRIASDLHDELGPLLSITKIEISEIETADEESKRLQQRANQHIEELTERLGGIARNLIPKRLLQKGLDAAMQDFFNEYQEVTFIQLHYAYHVKQDIPVVLRTQVYKMVQEIVHNAAKHSKAKNLKVVLFERKQFLYVHCKDDGIGMKGAINSTNSTGLGLDSLKNRAEMLGGRLQYSTNGGTEYLLEIPLTD